MKLQYILNQTNQLEKNSFFKIIDTIISDKPKNYKKIDSILRNYDSGLKNVETESIVEIFDLVQEEYCEIILNEFLNTSNQLDILVDIITRDGNGVIKIDWFSRLYETELKKIRKKLKSFVELINSDSNELSDIRRRDYKTFLSCTKTAFINDELNNQDCKITNDELSILLTLANQLNLSHEERKLINYSIMKPEKLEIEQIINQLKNTGIVIFNKKTNTVFISDEMVRLLRKVRGKHVADKFYRRILKLLREPVINQVCKIHGINRKLGLIEKIDEIIAEGIDFRSLLANDIHKSETTLTERKKVLNELCDIGLDIKPNLKGSTIDEKIDNLILYFDAVDRDEKVGISIDGYEKLMLDLNQTFPKLNRNLKEFFQMQEEFVMKADFLIDFNIKPRDILELLNKEQLETLCENYEIKKRGHIITNILDAYKDTESLFIENYSNIAYRNVNSLKENGIEIKESELGLKFEELTEAILIELGFNVDDSLKKELNTSKDKIDLIIRLDSDDIILIECKTIKAKGYNKFSAVSRQMKSYRDLMEKNGYNVVKSLLIAPEFSDDFINECGIEYELNLSLITSDCLLEILEGFRTSEKHDEFPYKLLMRDILIDSKRIIKAIKR